MLSAVSADRLSGSVRNCTPLARSMGCNASPPGVIDGACGHSRSAGHGPASVVTVRDARTRRQNPELQRVEFRVGLSPISGLSYKITFNRELWTSSFPLYLMKPNLRNLFMKKLTRARVVPIISA